MAETAVQKKNQNLAAEESLLGAVLAVPETVDDVWRSGIAPFWFADEKSRLIWTRIEYFVVEGRVVDVERLAESIREDGEESLSLSEYLEELPDKVPAVRNWPHYLDIVRESFALRKRENGYEYSEIEVLPVRG